MENMEIERKFLVKQMPELSKYPFRSLEQGYLCLSPTVRVRKEDDEYYLTYKSKAQDHISRQEYNLPLTKEAYEQLIKKAEGNIITKKRYLIPLEDDLTAELDVFDPPFAPLVLAEVEFQTVEQANAFKKPEWLGKDVSDDRQYYNSYMSQQFSE